MLGNNEATLRAVRRKQKLRANYPASLGVKALAEPMANDIIDAHEWHY